MTVPEQGGERATPEAVEVVGEMAAPNRHFTPRVAGQEWNAWVAVDVLREVTKNAAMALPVVRAARLRRPRAGANFTGAPQELERYAFQSVRSLLGVVGTMQGLDIVEFGPGDSLTSGFSLLAAGARSYSVIDRFSGDYSAARSRAWYKGIRDHWSEHFPEIPWPESLDPDTFPEEYGDVVHVMPLSIEMAEPTGRFDIVCSYQVGEHVNDVASFAHLTARLLRADGVAVHRVDFGPHDCWLRYPDPLTFLRFPDWLWSLMGSNRGYPNRHRHHYVLACLQDAGLQVEVRDPEVFATTPPSDRIARQVRLVDHESIDVKTAVYICRPG